MKINIERTCHKKLLFKIHLSCDDRTLKFFIYQQIWRIIITNLLANNLNFMLQLLFTFSLMIIVQNTE